jgi:hypothetical protein
VDEASNPFRAATNHRGAADALEAADAKIAKLEDVYEIAYLQSYSDSTELQDAMRKALAAVDKEQT